MKEKNQSEVGKIAKKVITKPKQVKKKPEENTKIATDLEGREIKREPIKKKKRKSFRDHFRKYKKMYTWIGIILASLIVIIGIYLFVRNNILNKKYKDYEDKMDSYGFTMMYNNQSAKSSQRVTKIEMVKIILSSIYNSTEVESKGFSSQGMFEGDEWATTAVAFGVIKEGYITKDNYDDLATYGDAIIAYLNARTELMDKPVASQSESSFKNLQSFTDEQRGYINDAVENGLIPNSEKKINIDSYMYKGEFNQLVINFVEKYQTMVAEGETLVTKVESKPTNYKEYPYIVYSVDKKVYEYKGINEGGTDYMSPVELYKYQKDRYPQMEYRSEYYYDSLLNINYNDITKESFMEKADKYLRYTYDEQYFTEYVEYVKAHKIIIEGSSTVQLPIFYLDGMNYRARIKLDFEIKSSDTDKNILFGDLRRSQEVTYKNKKYTIYIDAPMGTTVFGKGLRLDLESVIDIMVGNDNASSLNEF